MKSFRAVVVGIVIGLCAGCARTHEARSNTVEPATQRFLDAVNSSGGPPLYTLSPTDARAVLTGAQAGEVAMPAASIEDRVLAIGPTGQTRIRIVRPERVMGTLPVVMYFHGGGWMLGDAQTHGRLVRELVNGADVALVFVEYERAPEARFPVALEQCYERRFGFQDLLMKDGSYVGDLSLGRLASFVESRLNSEGSVA